MNGHLRHFEDLPLYVTEEHVISFLRSLLDVSRLQITIKVDSAPSTFAGIDPQDGQFFVAKKSLFNKEPILYKAKQDIYSDVDGDLAKKLLWALVYLKELKIKKNILQGDLLYTRDMIKKEDILGRLRITFQGNTLIYAADPASRIARDIQKSKIGIGLHTFYSGPSVQSLRVRFSVPKGSFTPSWKVWTPNLRVDISDSQFPRDMIKKCIMLIEGSQGTVSRISASKVGAAIEKYHNSLVRDGNITQNSHKYNEDLKQYPEFAKYASGVSDNDLQRLFEIRNLMRDIKDEIISSLKDSGKSALSDLEVYVRKKDGTLIETDHEGYVVVAQGMEPIKFVHRLGFSRYNFDDENMTRGWEKKSRQ